MPTIKIAATEEREIFTENTPLDLSMAETMLKPGGLMSQRNPNMNIGLIK